MSKKDLFLDNGFLNMPYVIESEYPFTVLVGGRCTGKTYGAIKHCIEKGYKFIYMRRTLTQLQTLANDEMNPFIPVCEDMGITCEVKAVGKNVYGVYLGDAQTPGALMIALSGVSSMRSFSARHIDIILYDEAIPEGHEKPIRNEADALWNAFSTINRERESFGNPPVKLVVMGNANNVANPIYMSLGIINTVYSMMESRQVELKMPERGLYLINLNETPIGEKMKQKSVLHKLLGDESATDKMMYGNIYQKKPALSTKSMNLKEYVPIVTVGEITIYFHKNRENMYVSPHGSGARTVYTTADNDLKRFSANYPYLVDYYLRGKILFETPGCEIVFMAYLKI